MVERRPWLDLLSHTIMIVGVALVAFPLYIAFVASTHTADAVSQSPIPVWPGSHMIENYKAALFGSTARFGSAYNAEK